jgi:hypothetical protein
MTLEDYLEDFFNFPENNCTKCKYFESYHDAYYDELEPDDQGFCRKGQNDSFASEELTCNLFERET